jgi:ketosteroid isomerase-like protein
MLKQRTIITLAATAFTISTALAQEPDRPLEVARIRSVIGELNKARKNSDAKAFSQFFVQDRTLRIGNEIIAAGRDEIEKALKNPSAWTEVTPPTIQNEVVRFVSPDVALVDAVQIRYGSVILKQSLPVTLLMKLDGDQWRIVSLWLHSGADSPGGLTRSHFLTE